MLLLLLLLGVTSDCDDVMDDITGDVAVWSGSVDKVFPSSDTIEFPSWWMSFLRKFVGPLMLRKSKSSISSFFVRKKRLIVIFLRF